MTPGVQAELPIHFSAVNQAEDQGSVQIQVSDSDSQITRILTLNYRLSPADGHLSFTQPQLNTGLARDEQLTETVELHNSGAIALNGLSFSLQTPDANGRSERYFYGLNQERLKRERYSTNNQLIDTRYYLWLDHTPWPSLM